jgi:outer membrane protein assembly factor BamA
LEYRFPLATVAGVQLYGALFTDIGNVWLLKKEAGPAEEVFHFDTFVKDLGVGVGTGLRIDFNFFVVRFDYSYKAKDPTPKNLAFQNKWFAYTGKNFWQGTQFQLGISYPFIL